MKASKLITLGCAAAAMIVGTPAADADPVAVTHVLAQWSGAPPESGCATSASRIDLSGYAGAGANPGYPVNAGGAQTFGSFELVPTTCDTGTVINGWIEHYAAGPVRVQGPSNCPVSYPAATGTYVRTGPLLTVKVTAVMHDAPCPEYEGYYDEVGRVVPISFQVALTPEMPIGTGVLEYGAAV